MPSDLFPKLRDTSKTFSGDGAAILSDDGEEQTARLALFRIEEERLARVRAFCAERGVTLNDFVLTLFCASIMGLTGGPRVDELAVQVMVDLRRYVSKYPVSPFGNFSSMETLRVTNTGGSFIDLASGLSAAMARIKTRQPALQLSFSTFQDRLTLGILGSYSRRNWETISRIVEGMGREPATTSEKRPAVTRSFER